MLIKETKVQELSKKISEYVGDNVALLSVAEDSEIDFDQLIRELNHNGTQFVGGVFPKVIHENQVYDDGVVINTLFDVVNISMIKNISKKEIAIPQIEFSPDIEYTVLTYVDGLTSNISNYLSALYESYGISSNYFGGGAGSLSLEQMPCVFSNEGIFMDAAVLCVMKMRSSIGVRHGWEKLEGPFIVTKADRNTIEEINWENPFQIYRSIVEEDSGQKFTDENFFDLAKGYPLGVVKQGGESVIRDPLMLNEKQELVCVGEVEENTLVDIMKGNKDSLIDAAKHAAKDCLMRCEQPKKAIIIDCISRVLFLEESFDRELNQIVSTLRENFPDISIGGALTLGEISSFGNGYLEFYNKTIVVSLFE
ncbi:MAG: FIST C-terminal domain-containing protein [Bacteroidia bacterium]|nr:FIST C-terminal domain-containing protein [Bacteroidia bacterium]